MRIACIFAHPDDEAFGPAGTIASLAKENEVHLICATRGQAGENHSSDKRDISIIREEELHAASEILGIKSVTLLDFEDGQLCNSNYHKLASEIKAKIDSLGAERLITFEPRGLTGHLDHIAVSMVCSYIFEESPTLRELWYFCLSEKERSQIDNYFIYFPPGYTDSEIDQKVDISAYLEQKISAIRAHASQKKDGDEATARINSLPKEECFLVMRK